MYGITEMDAIFVNVLIDLFVLLILALLIVELLEWVLYYLEGFSHRHEVSSTRLY